jgi:hypothetical protein
MAKIINAPRAIWGEKEEKEEKERKKERKTKERKTTERYPNYRPRKTVHFPLKKILLKKILLTLQFSCNPDFLSF